MPATTAIALAGWGSGSGVSSTVAEHSGPPAAGGHELDRAMQVMVSQCQALTHLGQQQDIALQTEQ